MFRHPSARLTLMGRCTLCERVGAGEPVTPTPGDLRDLVVRTRLGLCWSSRPRCICREDQQQTEGGVRHLKSESKHLMENRALVLRGRDIWHKESVVPLLHVTQTFLACCLLRRHIINNVTRFASECLT